MADQSKRQAMTLERAERLADLLLKWDRLNQEWQARLRDKDQAFEVVQDALTYISEAIGRIVPRGNRNG